MAVPIAIAPRPRRRPGGRACCRAAGPPSRRGCPAPGPLGPVRCGGDVTRVVIGGRRRKPRPSFGQQGCHDYVLPPPVPLPSRQRDGRRPCWRTRDGPAVSSDAPAVRAQPGGQPHAGDPAARQPAGEPHAGGTASNTQYGQSGGNFGKYPWPGNGEETCPCRASARHPGAGGGWPAWLPPLPAPRRSPRRPPPAWRPAGAAPRRPPAIPPHPARRPAAAAWLPTARGYAGQPRRSTA